MSDDQIPPQRPDATPEPAPAPAPAPAARDNPVGTIRRAVLYWAVLTVILELFFILVAPHFIEWQILPANASDRSGEINNVMWLFTVLGIPVFAMVVIFSLYSAFKWGSTRRPRAEGPAMLVSPRFIPVWMVISVVLVIFLYVYGLAFLTQVDAKPTGDVLQVHVTGEQWLWDYTYPQYGNVGASELYLVVNQPVTFTINSMDVQHSFWIPAFGIKEDAVPGEVTQISVTPKQLGTFQVRCAELCGLYHSYMETPVHVVTRDQFMNWVSAQQPGAAPTDTPMPAATNTPAAPSATPAASPTASASSFVVPQLATDALAPRPVSTRGEG